MASPRREDLEALANPGTISFADRAVKAKPYEWGFGSTPRVAKLREGIFSKAAVIKDWTSLGRGVTTFRKNVKIDMDRARIVTQSYKETEGLPWAIRRAKALYKICDELPIYIKPLDLIVGNPNSAPDEVRWYPETDVSYMPEAVTNGGYQHMLTEEEKKELIEDIYEYWKDKSLEATVRKILPDEIKDFCDIGPYSTAGYANFWRSPRGLANPNWEDILQEGIAVRIKRVENNLARHKSYLPETMSPAEYIKRYHNYEAMIIAGRAILRFAERYAELAADLAQKEADAKRRQELEEIAEICRWVPANPPRNFREALQAYWLIEVVFRFLEAPSNGSGCRLDQIWYPYYKKDIEGGKISRAEALELLECWMLNVEETGMHCEAPDTFTVGAGGSIFYTANIGGTTNGKDASNDLTCVIMEALSNVRTSQPPIAFRYSSKVSPQVIDRAIDLCRTGTGHPAFFNEDLFSRYSLLQGNPAEDTEKFSVAGCMAPTVIGKSLNAGAYGVAAIYTPMKSLELALWQGVDKISGLKIGADTPDPRTFKDANDLLKAVATQQELMIRRYALSHDLGFTVLIERFPMPATSFLLDDCPDMGIDVNEMSRKYNSWPCLAGAEFSTLADSLAAVQKLIYEEKKVSWDDLLGALEANWEGQEELRQLFLRAPKYGNDDDYADQWAVRARKEILAATARVKDAWGKSWAYDGSTGISPMALPRGVHATPDGRRAQEPGADSSLAPCAGRDTKGPTAVLNSIRKIPFMMNDLLNQRFMPMFLEGDNRKLFAHYLRQWYEGMNSYHVQFNVVNNEVLKDAQRNPEKHADLMVRVAGYSAYFVDLPKEVQDHLIARTEQGFA
jgi:formate C-acetyltransferase